MDGYQKGSHNPPPKGFAVSPQPYYEEVQANFTEDPSGFSSTQNQVNQPLHPANHTTRDNQGPTTQHIADLASRMGAIGLGGSSISPNKSNRESKFYWDDWVRPELFMAETGEQSSVMWDCPGDEGINYEASWYHLPDVPDFLVCTRCHDLHIAHKKLSQYFRMTQRPSGKCCFNVPRVTLLLVPQCLEIDNIEPLKDYFANRLQINNCRKFDGVKGSQKAKWFKLGSDTASKPAYVVCETCYEEVVMACPEYEREFKLHDIPQPDADTWLCGMRVMWMKKSMVVLSQRNRPWDEYAAGANKYLGLPECDGKVVEASSREWVRPRQKTDGLVICEVCYYNKIALTAVEDEFEYIPVAKPVTGSEWMDQALGHRSEPPTAWTCDAKSNQIVMAIDLAVKRQDSRILCRAATVVLSSPPCTDRGIVNGNWYTFAGGCDGYNLCAACYTCSIEIWGVSHLFQRVSMNRPEPVLCNNNKASPRFLQFAYKMYEATLSGPWSVLPETVRKYIDLPECPKKEHVANRNWYGWGDCLICSECYKTFCESTCHKFQLEVNDELITDGRMCCMYSPRMRRKWTEACEKGDPHDLIEFSRFRHGVYAKTVPQIKMLREFQQLQMMSAMSSGMASLMYQGAGSIQAISGSTDGYLHGNSSVGWYETENHATSAQLQQQMATGMNAANSPNAWLQIFQLSAQWDEVE